MKFFAVCMFIALATIQPGKEARSEAREFRVRPGDASLSLKTAISKAGPGDVIRILPGTYKVQEILIDKSITLIGEGMPVLDGQGIKDVITIRAKNVRIRGLIIQNSGQSSSRDYAGIKITDASGCIIENCRFLNNCFSLHINRSKNCTIRANYLDGNAISESISGNGIHVWKCDSFFIGFNTIERHRDGIYFEFVTNSHIQRNISRKNLRYGLHFMFSDRDSYQFNEFYHNGAGVAVMYTNRIVMNGNIFRENWGPASYGLLLKDINHSTITHNRFLRNTVGIYAEGSNKVAIRNNTFQNNGWALKIMGNCENDTVENNNFLGNSFDVSTNSSGTGNANVFMGNYWDKYKGYDMDRDLYGDVPYRPVSLFSLLVEKVPNALVLLRSIMTDVLDEIEKSLPAVIPETLQDMKPRMKQIAL